LSMWEDKETGSSKCEKDCDNGYGEKPLAAACNLGCKAQELPRNNNNDQLLTLSDLVWHRQIFQPFHHIGRYCSSMYNNVASYVVSTVDVQDGSGNTVILEFDVQPQYKYTRTVDEQKKDEGHVNMLKRYTNLAIQHGHKWLNCVERRAGLPYWSLVGILFLSIFFFCWVCCSSCDDRPIQKKHTFKEPIPFHVDESLRTEKPPPYFIIAAEACEAGPLPEKQPLIE
jgi:hypothetical protein